MFASDAFIFIPLKNYLASKKNLFCKHVASGDRERGGGTTFFAINMIGHLYYTSPGDSLAWQICKKRLINIKKCSSLFPHK